jgi:acyl carrier protein
MNAEEALDTVYRALGMVNELRLPGDAIPRTPHAILTGDGGALDSLALVTLVLAVEQSVMESTGREISLMGEESFDTRQGSFRTPAALAAYIVEKCGT